MVAIIGAKEKRMAKIKISFIIFLLSLMTSSCSMFQGISEDISSVSNKLVFWDINKLWLNFNAENQINPDDSDASSPVMVRVYQLSSDQLFNAVTYDALLDGDQISLGGEVLEQTDLMIKADTTVELKQPLNTKATFIGVVALFKEPNFKMNNWRFILTRDELKLTRAREVIINGSSIKVVPL